jgi:ferrochelatase
MRAAVLLLAHGAPERVEDLEAYLALVRGGRPVTPGLVAEIRQRYAEIGGGSPLTARTREQAEALQARLGVPVFFGMRNWHPLIRETIERIQAARIERVAAVCLAPQYSRLSVGLYFRRVQEARQALGFQGAIVWTKSFHDHPLLVAAFHDRLAAELPAEQVLFTAHSLPEKILANADPYDREARATARLVAARAGLADWDFAYQSQGMTEERWLGPTVESKLDEYAARGVRDVLLQPVGFVSDHVEILWDVDIQFRRYAAGRGITLRRPASLNDSPKFIDALADLVSPKLSPDRQGAA